MLQGFVSNNRGSRRAGFKAGDRTDRHSDIDGAFYPGPTDHVDRGAGCNSEGDEQLVLFIRSGSRHMPKPRPNDDLVQRLKQLRETLIAAVYGL